MTKRITKQQREANEKAALRRRVLDMAFGAFGGYSNALEIDPNYEGHLGMFGSMSPDAIGRWIGAVSVHLITPAYERAASDENRSCGQCYLLEPHCLQYWDDLDGIVEALYNVGVRA
jgi:hypothetical protein